MAKTKASAKAAAERLKEMTSPKPTEPPPKRARTKSTQGKVSETTPPPAEIDFDITWANFSKIKAFKAYGQGDAGCASQSCGS